MDIVSFEYAYSEYGVIVGALCRDQIGVDGFTLIGGYYDQAYYPSRYNEFIPAQTEENQVNMPIFRLLGADPIYNFEGGGHLRKGIVGVHSLEPVWETGKSKEWVNWYFKCKNDEPKLGFSYTQVGQENTFLWNNMVEGYEMQIPLIANLAKEGKIRLETIAESGEWFRKKYRLTPVATVTASSDWHPEYDLKTIWYNSRFYRMSLLWDENTLSIRDFFIFDEKYPSRYLKDVLTDDLSILDALPIMYPHKWSDEDSRASIDFMEIADNKIMKINGNSPSFSTEGDATYIVDWPLEDGNLKVVCEENSLSFSVKEAQEKMNWALHINRFPVLQSYNKKVLKCEHNNFSYKLYVDQGYFELRKDSSIMIIPENEIITLRMSSSLNNEKNIEFFQTAYLKNQAVADGIIPRYIAKPLNNNKIKVRAFAPEILPKITLKENPASATFVIKNPNETGLIRYTTDGTEPTATSNIYEKPILTNKTTVIKAQAFKEGFKNSKIAEGKIYTTLPRKDIESFTEATPDKKYNHNGAYDLIDGKKGTDQYTDGNWLGYLDNMDVIVDLGEVRNVRTISATFLQNTRAWIFFPAYLQFEVSKDGINFTKVGKIKHQELNPIMEIGTKDFTLNFKTESARYIKVFAKWIGPCPDWSPCAGLGNVYMFVDEIIVE